MLVYFLLHSQGVEGVLLHLSEKLDHSMELESINFLRIFPWGQASPILREDVQLAPVDQELQVESCVALSDCRVVQDSLAMRVPRCEVQFKLRRLTVAMVIQDLDRVELAILNRQEKSCLL